MKEKILLVDDALFIRQLVRNILTENGYEVVGEASNGKEAIKKYFRLQPDLTILDVIMPEMTGLEALEAIITRDPAAKVVMLSALSEQETIINALHLGAKDYMIKPVQKANFVRTIRRVLAMQKVQANLDVLLEIYVQIIEDLEGYIDSPLIQEIHTQITYILRSVEINHPQSLIYDSTIHRITISPTCSLSFGELNEILIGTLNQILHRVEQYIPYAKNIVIEAFRFVYLRNKNLINSLPSSITIKYPDWLESEINFVNTVIDYLFPNEEKSS